MCRKLCHNRRPLRRHITYSVPHDESIDHRRPTELKLSIVAGGISIISVRCGEVCVYAHFIPALIRQRNIDNSE